MAERPRRSATAKRIDEALTILIALGVPKAQQNERSALVLLTLVGMTPRSSWLQATAPTLGITEMMNIFRERFGKEYAPNTRETVRRFTVHQFVQMGLLVANPDNPRRPVNSPANRYQAVPELIELVRSFGTPAWSEKLSLVLSKSKFLAALHPKEREMAMVPVILPDGRKVKLTAGGQNELIKKIIEEFCPRFTPGGVVVYLGDAGRKLLHINAGYLERLGIEIDEHGKMPDVVVHLPDRDWLVLIEAVTSHGPIGIKRHNELKALFGSARSGLVFVTAFLTLRVLTKYLGEIAWETEVWIAESPTHLIHFNGERFLGPYE